MNRELLPKTVNEFLDYLRAGRNMTNKTIEDYASDIHMFLAYINQIKNKKPVEKNTKLTTIDIHRLAGNYYEKITINQVHNFLIYLEERGNGATTKNRRMSSIKTFFEYLKEVGKTKVNIVENLKLAKVTYKEKKHLTVEQMNTILNIIKSEKKHYKFAIRNFAVMTVLMNTGLRNAELRNIKISDIDFKEKRLYVLGKGRKERIIPLNDSTIDAINQWIIERERMPIIKEGYEDYLFINQKKQRMEKDNLRDIVSRYYEMANINTKEYHVHTIRHGALTIMMKRSKNIKAVQRISGHSSIKTLLDIYTHTDDDELKSVVNDLGIGL